jgi:hypothetical protein
MAEIVTNLHMHTTYSDGHATHAQIAKFALQAGLDAVITTDHNVWVSGLDAYHEDQGKRVLLLVGEEIHDPLRQPQKNHMLVFNANRELAPYGADPQKLLDQVQQANGLAFIAHPYDPALPAFHEDDLSWVTWDIKGYTGIELWNGFSELKSVVRGYVDGLYYTFAPEEYPRGPLPETLRLWDKLLAEGRKVVAVGGSDAHALPMRLGPIRRTVFPYLYHFRAVNTHLITPNPLSGNLALDRQMIYQTFRQGHAFIGYDLPASTRGFTFTAAGKSQNALMGDDIALEDGVTLQVRLPFATECRLLKDGLVLKTWKDREYISHIANQPGVYRVEAYLRFRGRRRGWIFSNPIYIR